MKPLCSTFVAYRHLLTFKFFSWMQKKLNGGGQSQRKSNQELPTALDGRKNQEQYYCHDQGQLLSIGTLGNPEITEKNNIQKQSMIVMSEEEDEDMSDFTPEEVGQLQKELRKLLRKKEPVAASADLPLDRFLNCPSSLEVDRRTSNMSCCSSIEQELEEEVIIDRTIRVILDRCKTVSRERGKDQKLGIGKKSISFLFNKMFFVCGNAFNPSPPTFMRDSRMEKLLRTMLSKKFNHPQNSTSMKKKQLEDGKSSRTRKESELDETDEKKNRHQWVKTDSEYIVLEI